MPRHPNKKITLRSRGLRARLELQAVDKEDRGIPPRWDKISTIWGNITLLSDNFLQSKLGRIGYNPLENDYFLILVRRNEKIQAKMRLFDGQRYFIIHKIFPDELYNTYYNLLAEHYL
jgi:hypothetical protein